MNSNSQRYISGAEWETLTGLHPVDLARACVVLRIAAYDPDTLDISDVPDVMTTLWCFENAEKIFEASPPDGLAVLGQDGMGALQVLQETHRILHPAILEALGPVAELRPLITKIFRTLLFVREEVEKFGVGDEVEDAIIARGLEKLQAENALDFLCEFNASPPKLPRPEAAPTPKFATAFKLVEYYRAHGVHELHKLARLVDEEFSGKAKLTLEALGRLLPANPGTEVSDEAHKRQGQRLRKAYQQKAV